MQKSRKFGIWVVILALLFTSITTVFCFSVGATDDSSKNKLHFINVGNGDAIVLESNGKFAMIDTGESTDYPDGSDPRYPKRDGITTDAGTEQKVIDYLTALGVKDLEFILLTHAHSDHMGGAKYIIDAFNVKNVYMKTYSDDMISDKDKLWDNLYVYDKTLDAISKHPDTKLCQDLSKIGNIGKGLGKENPVIKFEDMTIELFNWKDSLNTEKEISNNSTGSITYDDENERSILSLVTCNSKKMLLTSDAQNQYGVLDDVAKTVGTAAAMKLEHHGLDCATDTKNILLSTLKPSLAVDSGFQVTLSNTKINALASVKSDVVITEYYDPAIVVAFSSSGCSVTGEYVPYFNPTSRHLECKKNGQKVKEQFVNLHYRGEEATFYFDTKGFASTGFQDIGQDRYYFNSYGAMQKGWVEISGKWYYFSPEDGKMLKGMQVIEEKTYYFDANGIMQTGFQIIEKKCYYFHSDGHMATGFTEVDSKTYYFDESGVMQTGLCVINEQTYYFDSSGAMQKGIVSFDGKFRYFDTQTGAMRTGIVQLDSGKYYFDAEGFMQFGWQMIDNKWYYFSNTGAMQTGWIFLDAWYYLDQDGVMQTGRLTVDGVQYCMSDSGAMQTGWGHIDGDKWCYCNSSGVLQTSGWNFIGSAWYYLNQDGIMLTGWFNDGGNWYYLDSVNGDMKVGWVLVGETTWYFMNSSGVMQTGWQFIGDKWYFLDSSGAMRTGWLQDSGNTYYLDEENGDMKTGTVVIGDKTYMFDSSGVLLTGFITVSEDEKYYAGPDGALVNGWFQVDGSWYHAEDDYKLQIGLFYIDDSAYLFDADGKMTVGGVG